VEALRAQGQGTVTRRPEAGSLRKHRPEVPGPAVGRGPVPGGRGRVAGLAVGALADSPGSTLELVEAGARLDGSPVAGAAGLVVLLLGASGTTLGLVDGSAPAPPLGA